MTNRTIDISTGEVLEHQVRPFAAAARLDGVWGGLLWVRGRVVDLKDQPQPAILATEEA